MEHESLGELLDELVDAAWGYGFAGIDVWPDVDKIKQYIVERWGEPHESMRSLPGRYVKIEPDQLDWVVTESPESLA